MRFIITLLIIFIGTAVHAQMDQQFFWQDSQQVVQPETPEIRRVKPTPEKQVTVVDTAVLLLKTTDRFLYDSLFSAQNEAAETEIYQRKINPHADDYKFALLLILILIYLTWITYTYHKELRENITVLINSNLGQQIYRDREFSASIFKLITFLYFAIITGLALYLFAKQFHWPFVFESLWLNMLLAIGCVMIAYLIKGLAYGLLNRVFQLGAVISYFRFNSLVIYQMLGIGLFPLVMLSVFARPPLNDWALFASLGLIALALTIRIVKGFSLLSMVRGFRILYFLMYICALEIAPVLILIKLFSMWA